MSTGCVAGRGSPGEMNPISPGFLFFVFVSVSFVWQ